MRLTVGTLRRLIEAEIRDMPDVRQETSWTCGPASARAIIKALRGVNIPEEELADIADATFEDGTSPSDLRDAMQELGFRTETRKHLPISDLRDLVLSGRPVILDVDMWGGEHWVVVYGYEDGQFTIMDPSSETLHMDARALNGIRWSTSREQTRGGVIITL